MDSNGRELCSLGDRLFTKKAQLDELHQRLAEQFYPERANFTVSRIEGDEYASELYESTPAQDRRELSGALNAILRPRSKEWFKPAPEDEWRKTRRAMEWCDFARDLMRKLLYNRASGFQRCMKDGDDDFVSFGNAVPALTENPDRAGFLFETFHLRDNAWTCNRYGEVDVNHRKFKRTLRSVAQRWGEKALTPQQRKVLEKDPYHEIEIRHVCMPARDYDPYGPRRKWGGKPFASIYLNSEGHQVINEGGYWEFPYLHRRWRVNDDSVYGYSPSAMLGLVDSRVLQSQARVIMDAGELSVAPPLLAKRDGVLGEVNNFAGAITWLDMEYDERFGDIVRPLEIGGDVRLGLDMKVDTRAIIKAAWYLNKLMLPPEQSGMTAYEVSERIAEYIRSAGPIFEPFEDDNYRILDTMFSMARRLGYFGELSEIPPEVKGGEIKWEFDTPVSQAYRRVKVVRAREVVESIKPIAELKPDVVDHFDLDRMARDTAENIGSDAAWMKDVELVEQDRAARAEKMAEAEQMAKTDAMLGAADKAAGAGQKAMAAVGGLPQLAMQGQELMAQQQGAGGEEEIGFPEFDLEGMEGMIDEAGIADFAAA